MSAWQIIVASFGGSLETAEAAGARLTDAWTQAEPLDVRTTVAGDLEALVRSDAHAVVVVVDGPGPARRMRSQLAVLDESDTALVVLFTSSSEPDFADAHGRALALPLEADARLACARLHGLLHRQPEVARLRHELSIAHRFHGGLKGEIARMHEELQLAAIVQREFLPRELPRLYGVEFAALWRPAHYVSGDIYDVCRLDDDHVGVFIADAVGHGVPAALMTMVICRSITMKRITGSSYEILEPAEVLRRLNDDMIKRQGGTTRFATAAYALVDCRRRTMRFAGAGHPPPLLISGSGAVRELETPGGLLGVFPDETYGQIDVELAVDDRLVMFSDGFEQAFPGDFSDDYERRLPSERYREELLRLADEPTPAAMIDAIGRRINDQSGSLHQIDDLTLVCMRAAEIGAAPTPVDRHGGVCIGAKERRDTAA